MARYRWSRLLRGVLALAMMFATPAFPQPEPGSGLSQDELDQLLAPVALYPDQLLSQILIAATYPLEVVQAARFVQQNPDLKDDALDQALAEKHWDPSVQSLAAYPQVLAMMNENLEWMQRLGDAFLVDEARVMDTVQALRRKATDAGSLQSTPQLSVVTQDDDIVIDTAQPDVLYVPVYDPLTVYGPWWAPAYPPWFWCPPPAFGYPYCPVYTFGIVFGTPWPIWQHHWGWAHPHWHRHRIAIDSHDNRFWSRPGRTAPPPGGNWEHSPQHRRGVAYPNAATRDRFVRADPNAVRSRQDFRGYERIPSAPPPNAGRQAPSSTRPAPSGARQELSATRPPLGGARQEPSATRPPLGGARQEPSATRPAPGGVQQAPSGGTSAPAVVRPTPMPRPVTPFDPAFSRQQAQINAQRGLQSRQSIPSAPAPIGQPPAGRAPSAFPPAGPAPGGRASAPRGGGGRH